MRKQKLFKGDQEVWPRTQGHHDERCNYESISPFICPIGVLFGIGRYFDRQVKVASGFIRTEMSETRQSKNCVVSRKRRDLDIDFDWLTRSLYNKRNFSASFGDSWIDGHFPV